MSENQKEYSVALSFAGEDRRYVNAVAKELDKMQIKFFYDKYEDVELWGKDLYDHLIDVYKNKSQYTVIFISKHYAGKIWTNHERKAAQARAFVSNQDSILPVRFDDTEIPGILPTIGYIRASDYTPKKLAQLIKHRIGPIYRKEFFPENPDRLYKYFKAKSKKDKEEILIGAESFFHDFKCMNVEERRLILTVYEYCCPCGLPNEFHLRLEYLERLQKVSKEEIIKILKNLGHLSISTTITEEKQEGNEICDCFERITVKYIPLKIGCTENCTDIVHAIFNILSYYLCEDCYPIAVGNADFSSLSSVVGYDENIAAPFEKNTKLRCERSPRGSV